MCVNFCKKKNNLEELCTLVSLWDCKVGYKATGGNSFGHKKIFSDVSQERWSRAGVGSRWWKGSQGRRGLPGVYFAIQGYRPKMIFSWSLQTMVVFFFFFLINIYFGCVWSQLQLAGSLLHHVTALVLIHRLSSYRTRFL